MMKGLGEICGLEDGSDSSGNISETPWNFSAF